MVNKRGVPIGPTWLIRTLAADPGPAGPAADDLKLSKTQPQ